MAREAPERAWITLGEAGKYAGISPDILRGAVMRGELEAYEKPLKYGHTGETHRSHVRTKREFVDEWVRTCWRRADASTYGMAVAS